MYTPEYICKELNFDIDDIWNIYPYGSKVYGTNREDSDDDYIIVFKTSLLRSGSFKDNAVSNHSKSIQGTPYSKGGFIDAINNYMMPALEAISLDDDQIIKKKFNFKINKFYEKELIKKVITQSSNSWHIADKRWVIEKDSEEISLVVKKGIWHAIRILIFGIQMKKYQKIMVFDEANHLFKEIVDDINFKPSNFLYLRDNYIEMLKR